MDHIPESPCGHCPDHHTVIGTQEEVKAELASIAQEFRQSSSAMMWKLLAVISTVATVLIGGIEWSNTRAFESDSKLSAAIEANRSGCLDQYQALQGAIEHDHQLAIETHTIISEAQRHGKL